jgi:predicted nucleic acid-binding protein
VIDKPMTVGQSIAAIEGWMASPVVSFLSPGPRHLEVAFRLLRNLGAAGNLTTDAQLASLAVEYQAELCSNDSDFGRFAGLRWVNPLGA